MVLDNAVEQPDPAPQMRVSAFRVFVHDLTVASSFYGGALGLPLQSITDEWAVYDLNGVQLIVEAAGDDAESQSLVGRFLGVSLTSDDILSTFDVLSEQGVEFLSPPAKQEWGGYLAHFYDPDRNVMSLVG